MSQSEGRRIPARSPGMYQCSNCDETLPMHPDDFAAHLAWVMAKRFHELIHDETFAEKTIYHRIVG